MKTFTILLSLVLVSGLAMGQGSATLVRPVIEVMQLNDSTALSATYAASQIDTTISYSLQNYERAYIIITSTDSISMGLIKYSASVDGQTFEDGNVNLGAADSVSTTGQAAAAANGIVRCISIPEACMGLNAVKFIFTFNASLNGVTTPKYTAYLVRKGH